jgi:phosphatidylinositol N-acetylglucosaminyltransferase subunit A
VAEAIDRVKKGQHDPLAAHERIRTLYDWANVAERTERVYRAIFSTDPIDPYVRVQRYLTPFKSFELFT